MAKKLLGIDVGTGGTRAVLVDEGGRVLNSATAEHAPMHSPQIGWAEQEPHDWWRAGCAAIKTCLEKGHTSAGEIGAVGLTGQMHGLVLLDAAGEVLRPSIIWCDQRTGKQCEQITQRIGAERLIELTANSALTNFTLPKIWWVQQHEPEIWSRARTILLPKDYFRFRLTSARAIDVAEASGTLFFDVSQRKWSKPMLDASGISEVRFRRCLNHPKSAEPFRRKALPPRDCWRNSGTSVARANVQCFITWFSASSGFTFRRQQSSRRSAERGCVFTMRTSSMPARRSSRCHRPCGHRLPPRACAGTRRTRH